jgi:hypothetical protein
MEAALGRLAGDILARGPVFAGLRPCCTDLGRVGVLTHAPNPVLALCDADIVRASELEHPVQGSGGDANLGRLWSVRDESASPITRLYEPIDASTLARTEFPDGRTGDRRGSGRALDGNGPKPPFTKEDMMAELKAALLTQANQIAHAGNLSFAHAFMGFETGDPGYP